MTASTTAATRGGLTAHPMQGPWESEAVDVAFHPKHRDASVASTRLRAFAPIAVLKAQGVAAGLFDPAAAPPRVVVLGKRYGDGDLALVERLHAAGTRVVFDICDNMLFNPMNDPAVARAGAKLLRMLRMVDRITCSTPTLAMQLKAAAGLGSVPHVVDDPYEPAGRPPQDRRPERPILLWFGRDGANNVPNGIRDLKAVADHLRRWAGQVPFELLVCSNAQATYDREIAPLGLPSRFVPWTLEGFGGVLGMATAVLLPFMLNEFVLPKTHNRLTLSLGAGIPVLATGIPSYREFSAFCYVDDWEAGLSSVLTRPMDARAKAAPALGWILRRFSHEAIGAQWREALAF